jgi:glycine cleavage system H protein
MSNVPAGLRYAKSHEWLKLEADGTATVGITDYAQSALGDITYVQAPKVGASFKAGEVFGVVESVKAASDLYLPVAGTITAVNTALDSAPEKLNAAPYTDAWLLKIKVANPADAATLLDAGAYTKLVG